MKAVVKHPVYPGASTPPTPVSFGLAAGQFVFLSGQIGVDLSTDELAGPDVQAQTRRTLENIRDLLAEFELGMKDVVKVAVFLARVEDWAAMNEVYREFFSEPFPTRCTVGAGLVRPGCLVEIEAIAWQRS